MPQIGRKLYYDKATGNAILNTGELEGAVRETTVDEDFSIYTELSSRTRDSVGVVQLEYGQYAQDFISGSWTGIDLTTLKPLFIYPDPESEVPEPIKPLSEEVAEIKAKQEVMQQALDDLILGGAV